MPTMPEQPQKSPSERLKALAELQEAKDKEYGQSYKDFGKFVQPLLGEIKLSTPDEYSRFAIILYILGKLHRYGKNWQVGHPDSLDDLSVYAQMLQTLDAESNTNG